MSKMRVTFEVDPAMLFDAISKLNGDTSGVSERLVAVMLTGDTSLFDAIGLGVYGIEHVKTEKRP